MIENTEFMDRESACMVDAGLVQLKRDVLPHLKGSRWADPNLEQAAGYMRRLYEDDEYRSGIVKRAEAQVKKQLSAERIARLLKMRVTEIQREAEQD